MLNVRGGNCSGLWYLKMWVWWCTPWYKRYVSLLFNMGCWTLYINSHNHNHLMSCTILSHASISDDSGSVNSSITAESSIQELERLLRQARNEISQLKTQINVSSSVTHHGKKSFSAMVRKRKKERRRRHRWENFVMYWKVLWTNTFSQGRNSSPWKSCVR